MAVTAEEVFIAAMVVMDEDTEDGTFEGYPDEYKSKAWPLLTLLQSELLPSGVEPVRITGQADSFLIDDRTARTVLPYGLAAHLLMNEDQVRASFFNSRYDELKRKQPAKQKAITDTYSSFNGMV